MDEAKGPSIAHSSKLKAKPGIGGKERRRKGRLIGTKKRGRSEISQLLDVVAVVDPVMPQGVAESPEFADDVGHVLFTSLECPQEQ